MKSKPFRGGLRKLFYLMLFFFSFQLLVIFNFFFFFHYLICTRLKRALIASVCKYKSIYIVYSIPIIYSNNSPKACNKNQYFIKRCNRKFNVYWNVLICEKIYLQIRANLFRRQDFEKL